MCVMLKMHVTGQVAIDGTMEDEIRTLPFAKIDRCWGLLPLCLFSALVLCIFFKNGALFYVAFMEEFSISHQSASWPLNLSEIASHLSGLLVSLLQKKLSIYQIALLGCLLNSASLVASAFVPDIFWMSITLGVLNGLGIGMGILSVSFYAIGYFDKYRATASGFKYAGTMVAPLGFPLVLSALIREYQVRGTLLLLSAVTLNLIPLAMLMKNPRSVPLRCKREADKGPQQCDSSRDSVDVGYGPEALTTLSSIGSATSEVALENGKDVQGTRQITTTRSPGTQRSVTLPSKNLSPCYFETHFEDGIPGSITPALDGVSKDSCANNRKEEQKVFYLENYEVNSRKERRSSLEQDSILNIDNSTLAFIKNPTLYVLVATFTVAEYALQTFESTVLDYAMDKGIARDQAEPFITYVAAAEVLGQLTVPILWDHAGFRRTHLAALCLIAAAACFLAMPHATKFSHVIATAMTLGFPMGCLLTLKPVLLGDHLGVLRLAVCWGILGIAMLPFAFGGPLLIGVFRDTMGSYDNLYRMLSALCATFAAVMLLFAHFETRTQKRLNSTGRPERPL
ncbi:monocarboxylate transporter 12-like [Haemaphysalis longicornis]